MTENITFNTLPAQEMPQPATGIMKAEAAAVAEGPMGEPVVPRVPEGLTAQQAAALKEQAGQWVARIVATSEDQNLLEQVATLGIEAQQQASQSIEILKAPINSIIHPPHIEDREAPDSLLELRRLADKLDPAQLARAQWYEKVFNILPFFAKKQVRRSIERVQESTHTAEDEINSILDSLRNAGETILRSNSDVDHILKELAPQLERVKTNAYLCEEMMQQLQAEYEKLPGEAPQKGQLLNFTTFLSGRYLDLHSMRELYGQLIIGLNTARQNNVVRAVSLRRTIDVAGPALRIGTALEIINLQQQQAAAMDRSTREFVGNLTVRNAERVGESQRQALEDLASAALPIEKMKQAHAALIQAMDQRDELQLEVIRVAKANASEFKKMADELEARSSSTAPPEKPELKSIEAEL